MKRFLSFLLVLAIVLSMGVFSLSFGVSAEENRVFDESNIVLRFPVMSDVHIPGDGTAAGKFLNALMQSKKFGDLDALLITGDLTEYGYETQVQEFCTILTSQIDLDKTRVFLTMGNHELYDHELNGVPFKVNEYMRKYLGENYHPGSGAVDFANCRYHAKINGIDIVSISCLDYEEVGVNFKQEDIDWLEGILKASDPTKPVFIGMHPMVENTAWGSHGDYWADCTGRLYAVLEKYPNAVVFSGHLHDHIYSDKAIWQKEFTAVGNGSVYYNSIATQNADGIGYVFFRGSSPADYLRISLGLMVEVDGEGNTRITRMDYMNDRTILEPWIIPAPKADGSHLTVYNEESYGVGNEAPHFEGTGNVKIKRYDGEDPTLEISFDKAVDDEMVYNYIVTFKDANTGDEIKKLGICGDFYRASDKKTTSISVRVDDRTLSPLGVFDERDVICSVVAFDDHGLSSDPVTSPVLKGEKSKTLALVEKEPKKEWQFKTFGNFNRFPFTATPVAGTDYDSYPSPGEANAHSHEPYGTNGWQGSSAIVTKVNDTDACTDVIFGQTNLGFQTMFTGAREFWAWVDFSDFQMEYCEFGFRRSGYYGDQYLTSGSAGYDMTAYLLADGSSQWTEQKFTSQGYLDLSGFKGFVRFDAKYFYTTAAMPLTNLDAFVFRFRAKDESQIGKTFILDQVGFAGPKVAGADGTVEMLLGGQQFDEKQSLPVQEEESSATTDVSGNHEGGVPLWLLICLPLLACVIGAVFALTVAKKKKEKRMELPADETEDAE